MTNEFDAFSDDDWKDLAAWVDEHVAVEVAPGVDPNNVDPGVHDPDRIRSLADPDERDRLNVGDRLSLRGIINAWRHWTDSDEKPDGPVFRTRLGVSPWRERRRENPPTVPLKRDIAWLEWDDGFDDEGARHHQYHRAEPGGRVPVVNGAAGAVLTTPTRARSLGANPCPDCYPDEAADSPLASVMDTETGERVTFNVDLLDEVPEEALERLQSTRDTLMDLDSNSDE
jgi:hypothetical protein